METPLTFIDPQARGRRPCAGTRLCCAAACVPSAPRACRYGSADARRTVPLPCVRPQAVCNDGTPANFYFRKGADPTLWLIYLEGGMWYALWLSSAGLS
jgi:hypothetical protein